VSFDGKPVRLPRRDIGIVFQDYGLARRPFPEGRPHYLSAGVMLPRVIGYLTALAMSVVEKRLLKWRSGGH
jgi:hypothetical protein